MRCGGNPGPESAAAKFWLRAAAGGEGRRLWVIGGACSKSQRVPWEQQALAAHADGLWLRGRPQPVRHVGVPDSIWRVEPALQPLAQGAEPGVGLEAGGPLRDQAKCKGRSRARLPGQDPCEPEG